MDATFLLKNAVWIFVLSLVGVLGCSILLAVGLNLYRQERSGGRPDKRPALPRRGWNWRAALGRWTSRQPAAPAPAPGAPLEVLRLLRHPLTGRLIVEIAGRRFGALSEMDDADLRQGLAAALHDLAGFAGSTEPMVTAAPAPERLPTPPAPAAPVLEPLPTPPMPPPATPASPLGLNPLPPAPAVPKPATAPVRVPSMNPFRQMQVLREIGPLEQAAPLSIAEQIDAVLQQLIAGTAYAARQLAVRSDARGAVVFSVDGRAHDALDALPDAEVQAIFREAIRQWEARQ